MKTIEVISWDEADVPEGAVAIGAWGGFFERGMRWKNYLDAINPDLHPYLEAARRSAIENNVRVTGEQHQYDGVTPVFSNGRYFQMTYSSWGDFMAAVWSEQENTDLSYLDFRV